MMFAAGLGCLGTDESHMATQRWRWAWAALLCMVEPKQPNQSLDTGVEARGEQDSPAEQTPA